MLKKKVLVIDDDQDLLEVITIVLQMNGFEVKAFTKPNKIFEKIEQFQPNIILLDIQLSGADGRIVCKQIKETKDYSHIPVVLFSANQSYKHDLQTYLGDAFIEKPFEVNLFINKISQLAR